MVQRQSPPASAPVAAESGRRGRGPSLQRQVQSELRQHYRQITNQMLIKGRPSNPWIIGVTSAIQGEGKTTLAYGLATVLANDLPEQVMLIELDFERPIMANEMNVAATPGLAEVLQGGVPLNNAVRTTHLPNLVAIPAGQVRGEMAQLVNQPEWGQLWPALGQFASILVCDLPSVLSNTSTVLLTRGMSTLVFTVRAGATPADLVTQALDQLDRSRVAGIVLNSEERRVPRWLRRLLGEYDR